MNEFYDKRNQANSLAYEDEPLFIDNEKKILIQNHILPYNLLGIQQNIYLDYRKKKIMILIKELYNSLIIKLCKKREIDFILNLLIKIVSKGDSTLIIKFLDELKKMVEIYDVKKIVYKNPLFLHWLLETSFQAYMIQESNFDTEAFHPGFYIDPLDEDSLEAKQIFTEEKKKIKINEILEKLMNLFAI